MRIGFLQLARQRLYGHMWPILQTAVAAVTAWYLAVLFGVEHRPAFASIAAVISLGAAFGERRQRAVQLIAGVMLGIVLADLLLRTIGNGLPQIGVLVLLAMVAAVILGGSELLVTEAAVSSILVATLSSAPPTRMLEVLIGGGVALTVNTLLFPPDPVLAAGRAAAAVFDELGTVLRDAAAALGTGDVRPAESAVAAAEALEQRVGDLRHAVLVGGDTATWAPIRRRAREELVRYDRTLHRVDLAARGSRALARNVLIYVRSGRPPRRELADAVRELSTAVWELPAQFDEPWRSGDVLQTALQAAGKATAAAARNPDLAIHEIAGHLRSLAIDVVKTSEAIEMAESPFTDAPTEELLAALPLPATP